MEENHLHCRPEVNGSDSARKVALITGITGGTFVKLRARIILNIKCGKIYVAMVMGQEDKRTQFTIV